MGSILTPKKHKALSHTPVSRDFLMRKKTLLLPYWSIKSKHEILKTSYDITYTQSDVYQW